MNKLQTNKTFIKKLGTKLKIKRIRTKIEISTIKINNV